MISKKFLLFLLILKLANSWPLDVVEVKQESEVEKVEEEEEVAAEEEVKEEPEGEKTGDEESDPKEAEREKAEEAEEMEKDEESEGEKVEDEEPEGEKVETEEAEGEKKIEKVPAEDIEDEESEGEKVEMEDEEAEGEKVETEDEEAEGEKAEGESIPEDEPLGEPLTASEWDQDEEAQGEKVVEREEVEEKLAPIPEGEFEEEEAIGEFVEEAIGEFVEEAIGEFEEEALGEREGELDEEEELFEAEEANPEDEPLSDPLTAADWMQDDVKVVAVDGDDDDDDVAVAFPNEEDSEIESGLNEEEDLLEEGGADLSGFTRIFTTWVTVQSTLTTTLSRFRSCYTTLAANMPTCSTSMTLVNGRRRRAISPEGDLVDIKPIYSKEIGAIKVTRVISKEELETGEKLINPSLQAEHRTVGEKPQVFTYNNLQRFYLESSTTTLFAASTVTQINAATQTLAFSSEAGNPGCFPAALVSSIGATPC